MRVLVTGGAGFLAPHVAAAFLEAGHDCQLTDIRASGEGSVIEPADLTDFDDALRVTRSMDVVCHLGGVGDVYLALEKPVRAVQANVVGTATLLEACVQNRVQKFVYASTWEVYGRPHYQPIDEEHPCAPDHPYNITKLTGDLLVMAYDDLKGLPGVCLRLGTAYGPGMRPNSVFSIFIRKAMKGEPITVGGSGQQTRQFTHVRDIASGFLIAATRDVRGEVFNLVAEEEITVQGLADMVTAALPTQIEYGPPRPGDAAAAQISSDKARRVLGWEPVVSFRQGLSDLVQWYLDGRRA